MQNYNKLNFYQEKEEIYKHIINNGKWCKNWETHLDNIDDDVDENRVNSRMYKSLTKIMKMGNSRTRLYF